MTNRFIQAILIVSAISLTAYSDKDIYEFDSDATRADVFDVISSAQLTDANMGDVNIIKDNDESFRTKLQIIQNAKAGETLRLAYYIYNPDYSTSVFSQELIAAGKRGVKVKLLLDYITNYQHLDFFKMMQAESNGNIEVRLFGRPTRNTVLDSIYNTVGCGEALFDLEDRKACNTIKLQKVDQIFAGADKPGDVEMNISNFNGYPLSQLYLAGKYGKDANLLIYASQTGQGLGEAEIKRLMEEQAKLSEEDVAVQKKGLRKWWKALTAPEEKKQSAQMSMYFYVNSHEAVMNPLLNKVYGALPFSVEDSVAYEAGIEEHGDSVHSNDFHHLTDFIHHKIILSDTAVQTGGRNIEDSYHMQSNPLSAKYTFMDTDIHIELKQPNQDLEESFDRLWNFRQMVATMSEIDQHAPNDLVATRAIYRDEQCIPELVSQVQQPEVFQQAVAHYYKDVTEEQRNAPSCQAIDPQRDQERIVKSYVKANLETCLAGKIGPNQEGIISLADRMSRAKKKMDENAQVYRSQYTPVVQQANMTASENSGLKIHYLENVPYDKEAKTLRRIYGAKDSEEMQNGKYLHEAWVRGISNVCDVASKENPQRIIMHNAYFAMPSNLIERFGMMADGFLDCEGVTVIFLTNSVETTDLRIVNSFGSWMYKPFVDYVAEMAGREGYCLRDTKVKVGDETKEIKDKNRCATFEYREYIGDTNDSVQNQKSLHTKVTVLGDSEIIVSSANTDLRSYMMDTNNAMYIENAQGLVRQYNQYFDQILASGKVTPDLTPQLTGMTTQHLAAATEEGIRLDIKKYGLQKPCADEPAYVQTLKVNAMEMFQEAYEGAAASVRYQDYRDNVSIYNGKTRDVRERVRRHETRDREGAREKAIDRQKEMNKMDKSFQVI